MNEIQCGGTHTHTHTFIANARVECCQKIEIEQFSDRRRQEWIGWEEGESESENVTHISTRFTFKLEPFRLHTTTYSIYCALFSIISCLISSGWRTIKVTYYERNAIAKWVAISCNTSTIKDKNRFYRLFLLLLAPAAIHNVLYLQTAGNYHNWLNLKAKMLHKIILNVSQPPISNQNIIISTKWNRWAHTINNCSCYHQFFHLRSKWLEFAYRSNHQVEMCYIPLVTTLGKKKMIQCSPIELKFNFGLSTKHE